MTIFELAQIYARERALSDASTKHYYFVARRFVADVKVQEVDDIDRDTLLEWREVALGRNVSYATWNNYLRHLVALISFAAERKLIVSEPDLSGLSVRALVERPKIISLDKLQAVMAFVANENSTIQPSWYWSVLLKTLFYTGMRRRQLIRLKWNDVDLQHATIRLRATSSKNRRGWEIPIVSLLMPSLELLHQRTLKVLGAGADIGERRVFDISLFTKSYRSCRDGQMTARSISNFFCRVRKGSGINISAHMLRHTMATKLARLGLYKELQNLLGHTNMQTTMRYVHPQIEQVRSMAEHLDKLD